MVLEQHWTIEGLRSAVFRQRATISSLKAERHVTADAERELDNMLQELASLMGGKVRTAN